MMKLPEPSGWLCRLTNLPYIADVEFDFGVGVAVIHKVYDLQGNAMKTATFSEQQLDAVHEELNRGNFEPHGQTKAD